MFNRISLGRLQPPLVFLAGLIGVTSWGHGLTPLAALVLALWARTGTRHEAAAVMLAYYLGASWTIPGSSAVFFEGTGNLSLGLALWIGSAILLAAPWAALAPTHSNKATVARMTAALALVSLPPIGIIGWTNPWLAASLVVPGMAWGSLLIGFVILTALCLTRAAALSTLALCVVIGLATWRIATTPLPAGPDNWSASATHDGGAPITAAEQGARQAALIKVVAADLEAGKRVIVLPEQYLGRWSESWRLFIEAALGAELRAGGATLLIGAAVETGESDRTFNAALAFDGAEWRMAAARFAIPVAMWKPWAKDSTEVSGWGSGVYEVGGRRIMLSLCYEDVVMWLPLMSFAADPAPEVIVSMANVWWASMSPTVIDIQREHVEAWARIFDVPLMRAINLP